jgi:hypothetical protein
MNDPHKYLDQKGKIVKEACDKLLDILSVTIPRIF